MTTIVTVNAQIQAAPSPATLQATGAFVSQGATNTSAFTSSLLTQLADLTPLLAGAQNLTGLSYSTGVVTATVAGGHGFPVGDTLWLQIAGATPSGYNGLWLCTITSSTQFTYQTFQTLGSATVFGAVTDEDVSELVAQATTYFAQGSAQAVYVLELGFGSPAQGIASLQSYITANPNSAYTPGAKGFYYAYLVPRSWAGDPSYPAFLNQYTSPTAKTYFFTTATLANYTAFTALMKDAFVEIESPEMGVYPANAITAASWSGGVATFTTTTAHGVTPGEWFQISGCTPSTWNGWFQALPGSAGSTLYASPMPSNPGVAGVAASGDIAFSANPAANSTVTLNGVIWTFVASGATGNQTNIQSSLQATLTQLATDLSASSNSSLTVAAYSSNATEIIVTYKTGGTAGNSYTLAASAGTPSGPTLTGGVSIGGTLVASYFANAGIPVTEFSLAAEFYQLLQSAPSTVNLVPPFAFRFLFDVTPFPTQGLSALIATIIAANVNIIQTGAEGGITNTIITNGTTMDGNDLLEWYAIDWAQINVRLALANAVINGSNTSQNPLYYEQPGINRLVQRGQAVMNNGVAFGLLLNAVQPTVTGVPFNTYVEENPSDYKIGHYAGLACTITPRRGFITIVFNLTISFFPTGNF